MAMRLLGAIVAGSLNGFPSGSYFVGWSSFWSLIGLVLNEEGNQ
jgi:hypothetical protein